MTITKDDLCQLTQRAFAAFWQVIVEQFPEAQTGDLSPGTTVRLEVAGEAAIAEWIWANVPESRRPTTPTYRNESDGHTYWLRADGHLVAAPTLSDGQVDWDNWSYVDDFDEPLSTTEWQHIIMCLKSRKDNSEHAPTNPHQKK